ncbi:MAG: 2-oxoacid:acceptor oxidoreductase subunit alpha [Actinomycetia bacterium]|nr:2-oxoacid:acceptor oxidoreductase subunit alpha [Actinomycetes bacterium]
MAKRLVMGNEAVVQGALAAGCDFYAGYPITPATEIMEEMSRELPRRGGVFLQMEDELGALAAVIGAAWGGARAMTATSGPGFSLMQEHIGYAAMTETPCVVVDAQRGGPSTGLPTLPAQGDVMQARFGSHGDRPAIVLTASSVRGAYEATRRAFALAERHRQPVVLLLDAVVAHMREPVDLPPPGPPTPRTWPVLAPDAPRFGGAPFVPFGAGPPVVVTGLAHDVRGLPRTGSGRETERMLRAAAERIERDPELAEGVRRYRLDDAEVGIVAYGITARAAQEAVDALRAVGVRAGLLDLEVLWPLARTSLAALAEQVDAVVVAELNLGQMALAVEAAVGGRAPVRALTRADGGLFAPEDIARFVRDVAGVWGKGGRAYA